MHPTILSPIVQKKVEIKTCIKQSSSYPNKLLGVSIKNTPNNPVSIKIEM